MIDEHLQAKYLVLKMNVHQVPGVRDTKKEGQIIRAKKCALDCIDIIIDTIHPFGHMNEYWRKVKKCVADYAV